MGKSRRLQLKAMNSALVKFTDEETKNQKLSMEDSNTVRQKVLYNQPYNNIEVFKSNKIYSTFVDISNDISKEIDSFKTKE